MHDLVIKGGTVVDGRGGSPRTADVAIAGGRIVAQGTLDEIRAQREVGTDATLEDVFLKLVAADVTREDLSWIG